MPNVADKITKIVNNSQQIPVTFAAGAQTSSPRFCSGNSFIGLLLPSNFTTGDLSFYGSLTGVANDYYQLTDLTGIMYTLPTNANSSIITPPADTNLGTVAGIQIPLEPTIFVGIQNLIIYCSVPQSASRTAKLIMAPVLS